MLDQNTDRMWYVIGAVIIGAAIIFILNGTIPELFASVGGTFEEKAKETTDIVDGIGPKFRVGRYLTNDDVVVNTGAAELIAYDDVNHVWDLRLLPMSDPVYQWSYEMTLKPNQVIVPYGKTITLSYDIFIPDMVTGIHSNIDINNHSTKGSQYDWSGNDNDATDTRLHNDVNKRDAYVNLASGQWTKVWYSYTNAHVKNVDHHDLYDVSRIGAYNNTGSPLNVKIRNLHVVVN